MNEELLHLFTEECSVNGKFKENFFTLREEYNKLFQENEQLRKEILISKSGTNKLSEELKLKVKQLTEENKIKEHVILMQQTKLEVEEKLQEKQRNENELYISKIAQIEMELEEANNLLRNIHNESQMVISQLKNSYETVIRQHELEKQAIYHNLESKYSKLNQEKKHITHQVINATNKATRNIDHLRQENFYLEETIEQLKKMITKTSREESTLMSQLTALQIQYEKEKGDWISQTRHHECELIKAQAKIEVMESNIDELVQQRERLDLQLITFQNENLILKNQLYETENRHRKECERLRKTSDHINHKHELERKELLQINNDMKVQLDTELINMQKLSEKVLSQELVLNSEKDHLRKREMDAMKRVHNVRIHTENKYRAILEEKQRAELSLTQKISELEAQLIIERGLKSAAESQFQKLASDNEQLKQQCESNSQVQSGMNRLEIELLRMSNDNTRLADELKFHKQKLNDLQEFMRKEKEMELSHFTVSENELKQQNAILEETIRKLENQITSMELEFKSKIEETEVILKRNKEKSRLYAKLIWKLRQRLLEHEKRNQKTDALV